MTIASEITRIKTNIENAYVKAGEKGATIPELLNSEGLASCIESIPKSSGGGGQDSEYDAPEGYYYITYYDIDGTILYRDTVKGGENYDIPTGYKGSYDPDNLIFEGWYMAGTRDLGIYAKPILQNLYVCALYKPVENEKDYVFISANEEVGDEYTLCFFRSKNINITNNYAIKIMVDWGDGETEYVTIDDCTGNDINSDSRLTLVKKHKYASYGEYIIKLTGYDKNDNISTRCNPSYGIACILNYGYSSNMVNKVYEGSSLGVLSNAGNWYSYYTGYFLLNNLEILSIYPEYSSSNIWVFYGDMYESADWLRGNKKIKTLIYNGTNSYAPTYSRLDMDMDIYIKYIFGKFGLNPAISTKVNFHFDNISILHSQLWDIYNGTFNKQASQHVCIGPFLSASYSDHMLINLKHYDRNMLFKNEDALYFINDATDKDNPKFKLLTFTEYINFIDSEEFNEYKDFIYNATKTSNTSFLLDNTGYPMLGDIDINTGVPNIGRNKTYRNMYYPSLCDLTNNTINGLTYDNVRRFCGDFILYPSTLIKDANGEIYTYTQETFEDLYNISSFRIHDTIKDFNFYNTNPMRFSNLSKNIKELDLRNINFKRYNNGQYTQVANLVMNNNYVGKILLHEDIKTIGSASNDYNQFFYSSKADKIDISNWEGFDINIFQMFYNCEKLTQIIFPNNFNIIGKYAQDTSPRYAKEIVYNCKSLKEFEVPPQLTLVAGGLIVDCDALEKVWLPSTCENIYTSTSYYPFKGCDNTNLTIYTDATEKPAGWADNWNMTSTSSGGKYAKVYWGATKENYKNGDLPPES